MSAPHEVVFLFDCDNTLLDNDRVQEDLRRHLAREFGRENRDRYWKIFETLRIELGYADYLGALQLYRLGDLSDTRLLLMSSFLVDYPFASRLYPGALDAIQRLRAGGLTVRWRCSFSAAQDRALGVVGRGRRPCTDLRPQGRDAGCGCRVLPGPALRDDR